MGMFQKYAWRRLMMGESTMDLGNLMGILVGVLLAMFILNLRVPDWLLILTVGKPHYRRGSILRLAQDSRYMLVKNRRVRPPLDGEKMMWVYDGVILGIAGDGSINFRTGITCVPQYDLRPISGLE